MATENDSAGETSDQDPQGQQADTTEPVEVEQQEPAEPVKLADDHPLVKTLAANKAKIAAQSSELVELRAKSAQVSKLEEELGKRPTSEAVETLQTRYDRLEAVLQTAGGPLSRMLDSRSFTQALFESEKDVAEIVADWNRANPSTTSTALGSTGSEPAKKGPNMNDLLRSALK